MRLVLKVNANARHNVVEKIDDGDYLVHTTALPVDSRLNEKVIELLSDYFGIALARMRIIKGFSSHNKIIEVVPSS